MNKKPRNIIFEKILKSTNQRSLIKRNGKGEGIDKINYWKFKNSKAKNMIKTILQKYKDIK